MGLKRGLSFFDLMNIVIGAIVGSDIYIVPGLTAGLVGPLAILVWILAGAVSMILVIVFGYCSYYVPKVGGPFAFVSTAFDDFYGFIAGWSMAIAEIVALPVFAIVFTNYLEYFTPLSIVIESLVRIIFVVALVSINIVGVKAAGRLNDVLTIAKLIPLLLIIVLGLASIIITPSLAGHYQPFAPYGFNDFGTAFVLIFWAYAGFELGSLPADEVVDPKKNIPRAIISGMLIVTFFYVMTSISVFGTVTYTDLAKSQIPLVFVSIALLGRTGAIITGVGALASVSGTDETEVLGTARLLYAMAKDGLLPKSLSKIHPKFETPYIAIIIEGAIALFLSLFSGLAALISFAVFNLAVCYFLTCLSLTVLADKKEHSLRGQNILPWLGIGISIFLAFETSLFDKLIGATLIAIGIPVYLFFSPRYKEEQHTHLFRLEAEVFAMNIQRKNKSLAKLVSALDTSLRRLLRKPPRNASLASDPRSRTPEQ